MGSRGLALGRIQCPTYVVAKARAATPLLLLFPPLLSSTRGRRRCCILLCFIFFIRGVFFIKKLRTWNVFVEKIKTRLAPMNPIHPLSRKEVEKDGIDVISNVFSLSPC